MIDIPKRITFLRENKGYSVYKLAQISDVSSTYIHEIERGEKQPGVEIIHKLCIAMGLTLADFFSDDTVIEPELQELINNAKLLTKKQRQAFNEVFKSVIQD